MSPIFPLRRRHSLSYHDAPRCFAAERDHGARRHAGCDLYALAGAPVMAVADGQVVRAPYPFYDVVWAVEVSHPEVGLIRYGEVAAPPPSTVTMRSKHSKSFAIAWDKAKSF